MMKKALLVIDYVNDFVDDLGTLSCKAPGQQLDDSIAAYIEKFSSNDDFIVVANDSHQLDEEYNAERDFFAKHCIAGSWGAELYGKTSEAVKSVNKAKLISISKTHYSAFCGTPLDLKLRERGIKEIYLTGVCTDICVLHTAIDAYNLGYEVNIYLKGVASFDMQAHEFALKHMKNVLGANLIE